MSLQPPRFFSLRALALAFVLGLLVSLPAQAQSGPFTPKGPGLTPIDLKGAEPHAWPPPPEDDVGRPRRPRDPPCGDWSDLVAAWLRDLHSATTPKQKTLR